MYRLIAVIVVCLIVTSSCFGVENMSQVKSITAKSASSLLDVGTSRKKGHYFIHPYYGWHALSWIYWIKVKLVVVAFFAYLAWIWGLRYIGSYFNKCSPDHHGYYNYGHYRSLDENTRIYKIEKMLNKKSRHRRFIHIQMK